ncbi:ATP-binding cassette domain-containing protein [Alsobacter sp. SYSU M60028]|uniref:ATP-binding cassette domain-containing protein n=1 Tax=Alsobacter ponti TaxID=2962936 RepID=A0ABT1LFB8_9HYPH|nr:ATP-binding cassette domain-containing protein [Alsobacter ponti]MCP8940192.1 ATP-binding cassette domain-containing protein [Alsobacter ponti]
MAPEGVASVVRNAAIIADPSTEVQASPVVASSGTLAGDLALIARCWFGREARAVASLPGGAPTPVALASAAAAYGLEATLDERRAQDLRDEDCPCIVLRDDGSTWIVTRVKSSGGIEILSPEGRRVVVAREFAAGAAGPVVFVRPRSLLQGEDAAEPAEAARTRDVFRDVLGFVWARSRGALAKAMLANLLSNVLVLALPIYSMAVYDRVIPHLALETLWALSLGILIALVADLALRVARSTLLDAAAAQATVDLQSRFYDRLVRLRLVDAPRTAAALTVGLRELEGMCQTAPALLVSLAVDAPFVLVVSGMLYAVAGPVALTPVAGGALIALAMVATHHASVAATRKSVGLARLQANMLTETVEGLETIKSSSAEPVLTRHWERLTDEIAYAAHRGRHWQTVAAQATGMIGQLLIVAAMFISVYAIADGVMTVGAMAAATLLVGRVMAPIGTVVALLHRLQLQRSTSDLLRGVLHAPIEEAGDPEAQPARMVGHLELRKVSFTYPGESRPALKDIDLTIRPGERVAIVGRIGSGKSTLLRLLTRLLEPQSGAVLLDGADIRQVSPQALRRRFSLMSQDQVLFDLTLRANICLGLDVVDEARFMRAAAVSGAREIAARHPSGYAMEVGPRGCRLSGGERQVAMLARALCAPGDTLILDEPTAALDNGIEARIVRDLREATRGQTLIVATHRAGLLALVDRVVWMDEGRIVADGPKADVLARLGVAA